MSSPLMACDELSRVGEEQGGGEDVATFPPHPHPLPLYRPGRGELKDAFHPPKSPTRHSFGDVVGRDILACSRFSTPDSQGTYHVKLYFLINKLQPQHRAYTPQCI